MKWMYPWILFTSILLRKVSGNVTATISSPLDYNLMSSKLELNSTMEEHTTMMSLPLTSSQGLLKSSILAADPADLIISSLLISPTVVRNSIQGSDETVTMNVSESEELVQTSLNSTIITTIDASFSSVDNESIIAPKTPEVILSSDSITTSFTPEVASFYSSADRDSGFYELKSSENEQSAWAEKSSLPLTFLSTKIDDTLKETFTMERDLSTLLSVSPTFIQSPTMSSLPFSYSVMSSASAPSTLSFLTSASDAAIPSVDEPPSTDLKVLSSGTLDWTVSSEYNVLPSYDSSVLQSSPTSSLLRPQESSTQIFYTASSTSVTVGEYGDQSPIAESSFATYSPVSSEVQELSSESLQGILSSSFSHEDLPLISSSYTAMWDSTQSELPLSSKYDSGSHFSSFGASDSESSKVPSVTKEILPTKVENISFTSSVSLPSGVPTMGTNSRLVSATPAMNIPMATKSLTIQIEFNENCGRFGKGYNYRKVIEEFWMEIEIVFFMGLNYTHKEELTKITCDPLRFTFLLRDIPASFNMKGHIMNKVKRENITLPVAIEGKVVYYRISKVRFDPIYDVGVSPDSRNRINLSRIDIIVISSVCVVSLFLVCIGFVICAKEYYHNHRTRSFDLSEIDWSSKMDDYTLTKIPRPKVTYSENGFRMQSLSKKSGGDARDACNAEESDNLVSEVLLRVSADENGLTVGLMGTGSQTSNHTSPSHSYHGGDHRDQSKDVLVKPCQSPLLAADNPIYYADDDRFQCQ